MNRRGALLVGGAALLPRTSPPRPWNAPGPPELPPAVVPGSRNVLRARVVIVGGPAGQISGVFVYAPGNPGAGNLVDTIAGVAGKDQFGNNYGTGFTSINNTFGTTAQLTAAALDMFAGITHTLNLGPSGLTVFNQFGATILSLDQTRKSWFLYADTGSSTQGALQIAAASAPGTDPFGNPFPKGFTTFSTSAPSTFYTNLSAALLSFIDTVNDATAGGQIGLTSVTTANDALLISSPLSAASDFAASLILQRAATPGPAHAIISNADLRLSDTTPAAPSGGTSYHSTAGMPAARSSADGNDYRLARRIFTAAGQLVNSFVPSPVTGITAISVAAVAYHIRGMIIVAQGGTGPGNQAIQITGPAITRMNIAFESVESATIFSSGIAGALNANIVTGAIPLNTTGELHFDGIIRFSAAGATFGLTALCVTSGADTWTLGVDSYLELSPL